MGKQPNHELLINRGIDLHEGRKYSKALKLFDQALLLSPGCAYGIYNKANSLHMLDRDVEAEILLRDLIQTSPEELRRRCPVAKVRSLHLDAYMLLFWVILHGRGFCEEAFEFAEEHLLRRKRGLYSVWSINEVRSDIKAMRKEWEEVLG